MSTQSTFDDRSLQAWFFLGGLLLIGVVEARARRRWQGDPLPFSSRQPRQPPDDLRGGVAVDPHFLHGDTCGPCEGDGGGGDGDNDGGGLCGEGGLFGFLASLLVLTATRAGYRRAPRED